MKLDYPIGTTKYLRFRDETVAVTYCADGLWRSPDGCLFGFPTADYDRADDKCGVWLFSLPADDPMSIQAAAHDYQYSCPLYQLYHTRKEADLELYGRLKTLTGWRRKLAYPFYLLSRIFGGLFWEVPHTR